MKENERSSHAHSMSDEWISQATSQLHARKTGEVFVDLSIWWMECEMGVSAMIPLNIDVAIQGIK